MPPCSTSLGPQQLPGASLEGREGCSGNNLVSLSQSLPFSAYWNSQFVGPVRPDQGLGVGITFLDTARILDSQTIEVQRAEGNVVRYSNGVSEFVMRDDTSRIGPVSGTAELELIDADLSRIRFVKTNGGTFLPTKHYDNQGKLVRENVVVNGAVSQVRDLTNDRTLQLTYDPRLGKYSSVQDSFGRSYSFGYSGKGQLSTINGPAGTGLKLSYNGTGNLTELQNLKTNQLKMYEYYPQGNVLKGTSNGSEVLAFTYTGQTVKSVSAQTGITRLVGFSQVAPGISLATKRVKNGVTIWTGKRNSDGNLIEFTDAFNRKTTIAYIAKTPLISDVTSADGRWKYDYDPQGRALKVTQFSPSGALVRTRSIGWTGILPASYSESDASGTPVCEISTKRTNNTISDSISTTRTFGFAKQGIENRLALFSGPGQTGQITFTPQGSVSGMVSDGVSCSIQQTVSPTGTDFVALRAGLGLTARIQSNGATTLAIGDRNGAVVLSDSSTCSASPLGGTSSQATNFSSAGGLVRTFAQSSWQVTDTGVTRQSTSGVSR